MELRHSDVGRTSRQSNMGTVDDTAFVFIIRGAINVRSGAMSVQPPPSLRLDLEVQRMCCCVRFVRPPTCGCYRALYIVSVVRLSYVVHYVQTPETPLSFTDARSPLRYSTPGKEITSITRHVSFVSIITCSSDRACDLWTLAQHRMLRRRF